MWPLLQVKCRGVLPRTSQGLMDARCFSSTDTTYKGNNNTVSSHQLRVYNIIIYKNSKAAAHVFVVVLAGEVQRSVHVLPGLGVDESAMLQQQLHHHQLALQSGLVQGGVALQVTRVDHQQTTHRRL